MSLASLEHRSGRLPAELTSFVGRRAELDEIARLFTRCRLVTLTGPGGVGKTRLAMRAAVHVGDGLPDGVRFVDLGSLRDPALLAQTVAERLELLDQEPAAALDVLVAHLADRRMLLVLDTCEHLVDAVALLSETLLRSAPGLLVLATGRQPLEVPGEHTVVVAPLSCPKAPAGPCESMELFADRAAAVVPGWRVTDANRDAVALLCHRLDGIPLAIELAAVQLRALSVEQLLDRFGDRLVLARGRRTSLPRHRTLRTAIDWSHELCTPGERLLWARLSVFAGDFDLESAEHVCRDDADDGELPAEHVLDTLAGLVAKSVVLRVERDGDARYRMLDTLREYGAERLAELGQRERTRERAFDWFAGQVHRAREELATAAQPGWLRWFRDEQANVRAVLDHALRDGDGSGLYPVFLGFCRILALQGLIGEARHWLRRLLDVAAPDRTCAAEALALGGLLATLQDDLDEGRAMVARAAGRAGDDPAGLAYVRQVQGTIELYSDRMPEAARLLAEAERLHRAAGSRDVLVPIAGVFLSAAHSLAGDTGEGERHAAAIVREAEDSGEQWCLSYGLCMRALARLLAGDPAAALPHARAALAVKDGLEDRLGVALALDITGACLIGTGGFGAGVRLFGAGDRLRTFIGTALFGRQHAQLRAFYEKSARDGLGDAAFTAAFTAGRSLDTARAVAEALGEAPERPAGRRALTRREREVAALVAGGLSNREIAERLVISKRTVDSHLEHILGKLGFTSRVQIATWHAERSPEEGEHVP
ncbi:LuxR C-terminal-related transcriptional regulator [Actinomadura kijaniata]|uniref:LuxR C-terminal-related transcriptional regulator n=1 Tax=Actinomadura kijaniata TaxID=46161 RepID=UPI003F1C300C